MTDLDFKDNRYPTLPAHTKTPQHASAMIFGASDRSGWDNTLNRNNEFPPRSLEPNGALHTTPSWAPEQRNQSQNLQQSQVRRVGNSAEMQSLSSQSQEPARSTLSYALPSGAARRVVERYSLDDNDQRTLSRASTDTRPTAPDPSQDQTRDEVPQAPRQATPQERPISTVPKTLRTPPSGPVIDMGPSTATNFSPIMPLSASPSYNPPIAPKHRAYAQQPTYITPPTTPTPINTVYSPRPPPQEEVCVECAMRDQDMADVDVTSPGVWERESDAVFEDLKRRELEDDANGLVTIDDPRRPRVKGGRLTEQNLKLWLSVVRFIIHEVWSKYSVYTRILENLHHASKHLTPTLNRNEHSLKPKRWLMLVLCKKPNNWTAGCGTHIRNYADLHTTWVIVQLQLMTQAVYASNLLCPHPRQSTTYMRARIPEKLLSSRMA